ncbi:MAG: tRNA dihydrouridine synthase DusB [Rubellimicrobium sp.]|nr:tRNA dihydrouridine synthase DusB [Rubellimicrobium sp.]
MTDERIIADLPGRGDMAPVVLAPLSGITDLPFRRLVAGFGARWVVSEMVAAGELLALRPGSRERAELGLDDGATVVQLVGRAPGTMAEAARVLEGSGARIIDINMGCPARKVTGGLSGSALMRDLDQAERIIAAVVQAVALPVTVKMRLGWDGAMLNAPDLARRAEGAGARMIAVHGRTRAQFYTGRADWAAVRAVKDATRLPVLVNGDIASAGDAARALALSGADAVMVGRAARGRPWLLAQIAAGLAGRPVPQAPQGAALVALVAGHHDAMLSFYGTALGAKVARKHLGWFMDHAGTPPALRQRILTAPAAGVAALLGDALAGGGRERAEMVLSA